MPQIKTTALTLNQIYIEAEDVIRKSKTCCPKCWSTDFAFRCFGRQTQTYTYPTDKGLWAFNVDKARELVGFRVDGWVDPEVMKTGLGETEEGHEFCLLRRANAGVLPPTKEAVGIVVRITTDDGQDAGCLIIDGTHRGRLCMAAGVQMPIAVLTEEEFAACLITKPGDDIITTTQREVDRVTKMYAAMDADYFFETMQMILGQERLSKLLKEGEPQ